MLPATAIGIKACDLLVILLAGGTKARQQHDIEAARKIGKTTSGARARESDIPLTRDFRETIRERAQKEPAFRRALLQEAIELMLSGDLATGKALVRNYINATVGFSELRSRSKHRRPV